MVGSTEPSGLAGCRYNTGVSRLLVEQERRSASPQTILCINDPPSELRFALYCDSDFVGCVDTSRSTSGYVLAIAGPANLALLSWSSKRQKVVSRSSTEAEFVSLSGALFNDAILMHEVWDLLIPRIPLHIYDDNVPSFAIWQRRTG